MWPQISVSGSFPFILSTNNLSEYLHEYNRTIVYATRQYNTATVSSGKCGKTKQLLFGRKKEQVGGLPDVEAPKETKYLGITPNQKQQEQLLNSSGSKLHSTSIQYLRRIFSQLKSNSRSRKMPKHARTICCIATWVHPTSKWLDINKFLQSNIFSIFRL